MSQACSTCGSEIRPGSPAGQCPRCLLGLGREKVAGASGEMLPTASDILLSRSQVRHIGDYELIEEIARGGMGVVYRAQQISLGRTVALKMILAGHFATPELVARFQLEARAAAALDHPHIVPVYEVGEHETQHYFVMKLVEGGSLAARVADFRLAMTDSRAEGRERARRVAMLLAKLADALAHAHAHGVLHRDVKPTNILLDGQDEPMLTDFGLAKLSDAASDLTLSHAVLGTPSYMSPEQAAGRTKSITTAADVYGLGAVLYELLTGRPPFLGDTPLVVARQVIEEEPDSPLALNPGAPRDLGIICLKCLEKKPTRRYPSAAAVAEDLKRWLRHEPILARASTPLEQLGKWVHRNPLGAALVTTVVLAGTLLVVVSAVDHRRIVRAQRATQEINRELETHLRRVEWQQAEESLAAGRTADAMAAFARFARETPDSPAVAKRLTSLLEMRAFALPALPAFVHGVPVNLARMDASFRRLLTVADDGVLRSWNLESGTLEAKADLDLGPHYLSLLPNGEQLLAATKAGRVILWDFKRWHRVHEFGEVAADAGKMSVSSEGAWVAMVTPQEGEVQLWNVATATLRARTRVPEKGLLLGATLGPEGESVIRGRTQGMWLWHPGHGELLPLLDPDEGPVYAVCDWVRRRVYVSLELVHGTTRGMATISLDTRQKLFSRGDAVPWHTMQVSPDGKRLLVSRWGDGASVLDTETLTQQFRCFGAAPIPANVSADADFQLAFRALHDGSGRLYDLRSGEPITEPIRHEGRILSHELSPNGDLLITTSQDGTARVWNLRMRAPNATHLQTAQPLNRIAVSPDQKNLAVAANRQVRLFELSTGRELIPPAQAKDVVFHVCFSPDGASLAVASFDHSFCLVDAQTGEIRWRDEGHRGRLWRGVFSPDGQSVASISEDGTARVFEAASGRLRYSPLRHQSSLTDLCFSPDRKSMVTASQDATAQLWDVATGQPTGQAFRHQGTVSRARFSSDGRRLLTASLDGTAQIWHLPSGEPAAPPIRSDQGLSGACFSADDLHVLVSTLNGARIFNAHTSEPLTPVMRHADQVRQADFSPDGRWVATISDDGTARVWEARSGLPVTEPLRHQGWWVTSLIWLSPNRLLTSAEAGQVRMWNVPELESVPAWLADLAEALANKREDHHGGGLTVSSETFGDIRKLVDVESTAADQKWLRWFLIERLQDQAELTAQAPGTPRQ